MNFYYDTVFKNVQLLAKLPCLLILSIKTLIWQLIYVLGISMIVRFLTDHFCTFLLFFLFSRMNFIVCLVLLAASALLSMGVTPPLWNPQQIVLAPGQKIEQTIKSANFPNDYPKNAGEKWNINTDEDKTQVVFQTEIFPMLGVRLDKCLGVLTKLNIKFFIIWFNWL